MCVITHQPFVFPDGHREVRQDKNLCHKSDGVNPCYHHVNREEDPIHLSPRNPGLTLPPLVSDDIPTPVSSGLPGTPVSATAGAVFELPRPSLVRTESRREKTNKRVVINLRGDEAGMSTSFANSASTNDAPVNSKEKKRKSHRRRKSSKRPSDDRSISSRSDDPLVAIEEKGKSKRLASLGQPRERSPLGAEQPRSGRRGKPRIEVHETSPPTTPKLAAPAKFVTRKPAMENVRAGPSPSFSSKNDVRERAEGRERLRQEERERRQRQEEVDRKLGENLSLGEVAEEQAKDEYSLAEYERIQAREQIRDMIRRQREQVERAKEQREREEQDELDTVLREMRNARSKKKAERDAARLAAEESRQEQERLELAAYVREKKAAAELARFREDEDNRLNEQTQAEVTKILQADDQRKEEEENRMKEIAAHVKKLEREIAEAKRDAELREMRRRMLADEINKVNRLSAEIAGLENRNRREDGLVDNEAEKPRLDYPFASKNRRGSLYEEDRLHSQDRWSPGRAQLRRAVEDTCFGGRRLSSSKPSGSVISSSSASSGSIYSTTTNPTFSASAKFPHQHHFHHHHRNHSLDDNRYPRSRQSTTANTVSTTATSITKPDISATTSPPSRNKIRDPEYRRKRGEQVLEREEAFGRARAAAEDMQRVIAFSQQQGGVGFSRGSGHGYNDVHGHGYHDAEMDFEDDEYDHGRRRR